LTFGQTSQLKLEIRLIGSIFDRKYVIPLPALENYFSTRLSPIWLIYGQVQADQGWKFDF